MRELKEGVFAAQLAQRRTVKLIFRGRILKESEVVSSLDLPNGCFMHASISSSDNRPEENAASDNPADIENQRNAGAGGGLG